MKQKISNGSTKVKEWNIIHPDGTEETIKNLEKFCREHNLRCSCLRSISRGEKKQHKGFKCKPKIASTMQNQNSLPVEE